MNNTGEDDEWEYIYDNTETETITFTIDLSATPIGPGIASSNEDSDEAHIAADDAGADIRLPVATTIGPSVQSRKPSMVQFLGLASQQPYISYKGQVFIGTWGQNIGSDLVFAATTDMPSDIEIIAEDRDESWALLGISQTTLIAKPVELIKRRRLGMPAITDTAAPGANGSAGKIAQPFTVMLKSNADPAVKQQAEYLEQLQAIKIARGEKDIVYLGKATNYIDADGKVKRAPNHSKEDAIFLAQGMVERGKRGGKKKKKKASVEEESDPHDEVVGQEEDDESENSEKEVNGSDEENRHSQNNINGETDPNGEKVFPRTTPTTFDIATTPRRPRSTTDCAEQNDDVVERPAKKTRRRYPPRTRRAGGGLFRDFDGNSTANGALPTYGSSVQDPADQGSPP